MGWVVAAPAWANCAGQPGSLAWYEPVMSAHLQRIQSQPTHSWSTAQIVDRLEGDRIFLTEAFESLSGPQKSQAINDLLEINFETEVTAEQLATVDGPPPYKVVAHDGRLLSAPYDGCTRNTLLTEQSRFSWYYNEQGRYLPPNLPPSELRNAGQPSWRQIRFPIGATAEKQVRLGFWQSVGYQNANWWIAWVPERGYFEVNVPVNFDYDRLQRYWRVADRNYRYAVVRADGTRLGEKRF